MQRLFAVPDIPSGHPLNPERGFFSLIVPVGSTNLCANPSFETGTTGYTATNSAAIARSTTAQRYGAYSLQVSPTTGNTNPSGVQYDFTASSTAAHTLSVFLLGAPGETYRLAWMADAASSTATPLAQTQQRIDGQQARWIRLSVTYHGAQASTAYDLRLERIGSASGSAFYCDGWQIEALAYETTYIDGDRAGLLSLQQPPAYRWNGTPHASTSTRSGQTRAGGRVFNLQEDYGLLLTGYAGLGLSAPEHSIAAYAVLDGGRWQDSVTPSRTFDIRGQFARGSFAELRRVRAALRTVLQKDYIQPRQPLVIRYQPYSCSDPSGDAVDLVCLYAGGLEEDVSSVVGEQVVLRFVMPDPALRSIGEQGATLDFSDTLTAPYVLERVGGRWTGITASAFSALTSMTCAVYDPNSSYLYVGGGDAGATEGRVVRYDTVTGVATALGGGAAFNDRVWALAVGADGQLYAAGAFTQNPGGTVTYNRVARWDGSAWQVMSTGVNVVGAILKGLTIGPDGTVYTGGSFADVRAWNGSSWSVLGGAGASDGAEALAFGQDGALYAATEDGTGTDIVARWDGSTWATIGIYNGGGLAAGIYALATGIDGRIYAAGDFDEIGSLAPDNAPLSVAVWNGNGWGALGVGLTTHGTAGDGSIQSLAIDPLTGALWATGEIIAIGGTGGATGAGGTQLNDGVAVWSGGVWSAADFDGGGLYPRALAVRGDGRIAIGAAGTNVATSGQTSVTLVGDAPAAPVFQLTGPGTLYQIANLTTGQVLPFANLTLLAGETLTIDLTPGAVRVHSTFRGNLVSTVAPGPLASFRLIPGTNLLTAFVTGSTGATALTMRYRPTYTGVDSLTE